MERQNKLILAVAIILFIALSQYIIFEVDRENWFDASFSLETAHMLNTNGFSSIDFREHDVHPPLSYYALASWQNLRPYHTVNVGEVYQPAPSYYISEYHWGQQMSVLFGLAFLVFAFIGLTKFFGNDAVWGMVPLVLGSTYLHFATEVRMYIIVLSLSALIFAAIAHKFHKGWKYAGLFAILILPMIHYLAALVPIVMALLYWVWAKDEPDRNLNVWLMGIAWIAGILVALNFAIPQRFRTEGTWFQSPTISSWMSAAYYSIFMGDVFASKITRLIQWIFTMFEVLIWCLIGGFSYRLFKHKKLLPFFKNRSDMILLLMILTAVLPLFALSFLAIGKQLLGGGAFWNLYHHRFFLSVTWLFASGLFIFGAIYLKKFNKYVGRSVLVVVILLFAVMLQGYAGGVHHELRNTMDATPCPTNSTIWIVHESPFSSLPYAVYQREKKCNWQHAIVTRMSDKMSHSAGFDAIGDQRVYWDGEVPLHEFYYVQSGAQVVNITDREYEIVHSETGINLVHVMSNMYIEVVFK